MVRPTRRQVAATLLVAVMFGIVGMLGAPQVVAAEGAAQCTYRAGGALPDRGCTPGAYNSAVTQRTIGRTICTPGWAATVRPPVSVTEPQKFASMRAYGISTSPGHAQLYEYDHLVPLELGGAPDDLRNLWPEPHHVLVAGGDSGSYTKDGLENRLHARVCAGTMRLAAARAALRGDWRLAGA